MLCTSAALLARTCWLTLRSMIASSSALIGWKCEKSKRRRSGATSEPFCCTWVPSTSRRAACSRWVAEWLRMVAPRRSPSTWPDSTSPIFRLPWVSLPTWPWNWPANFWVSLTCICTPAADKVPVSPTWPPDSA
ncbi:hypothetical protein D3C72_1784190 [compost metagenome]